MVIHISSCGRVILFLGSHPLCRGVLNTPSIFCFCVGRIQYAPTSKKPFGKNRQTVFIFRQVRRNLCLCKCFYCKRKLTGSVNLTRTCRPRCSPGVHLGIDCTTRTASLSKCGSTPRTTCISTIVPSVFTTN